MEPQSRNSMINFLQLTIPNLFSVTASLRHLLKSDILFEWGTEQNAAMMKV